MKIQVQPLCSSAVLTYGSAGAAAFDLRALRVDGVTLSEGEVVTIYPNETRLIGCGFCVAIPEHYVGLIYARSGMALKRRAVPVNCVGVVDPDYRGEVMVPLHNGGSDELRIESGLRIAQMLVSYAPRCEFDYVQTLGDTERASGGFGSTGVT